MGTEEHWTELLGHEITSPVLQQVTRASFETYSNPRLVDIDKFYTKFISEFVKLLSYEIVNF